VLTLAESNAWQCVRCGRGSPDIRDEAAHLDAHRRLERDRAVVTWELLVHRLTIHGPQRRRKSAERPLMLSILAALLLALLLLSMKSGGEILDNPVRETAPATTAEVTVANTPTTTARPSPQTVPDRPVPFVPPVPVATGVVPSPPAISKPLAAGPTSSTTTPAEPVDPPHLVELCLLRLCLTV
jgi:hypothetical protein